MSIESTSSIGLDAGEFQTERDVSAMPAKARTMWARLRDIWPLVRTRIWWGWRFHTLGRRTRLGCALLVNNPKAVAIGGHVTIMRDFVFADLKAGQGTLPKIRIGDGCTILFRFQCNAAESVTIGRNVLMASNVLITDSDHVVEPNVPVTRNSRLRTKPVCIGDNCWLGQNAVILKGVTIGDNCIIGANSVVTADVPSNSVAAGNPAKIIKSLSVDRNQ